MILILRMSLVSGSWWYLMGSNEPWVLDSRLDVGSSHMARYCSCCDLGILVFMIVCFGDWLDSIESWLLGRLLLLMPRPKWVDLGSFVWLIGAYFWWSLGLGSSPCDSCCVPRLKWVDRLGFGLVNQPENSSYWYLFSCCVCGLNLISFLALLVSAECMLGRGHFLVSTRDMWYIEVVLTNLDIGDRLWDGHLDWRR